MGSEVVALEGLPATMRAVVLPAYGAGLAVTERPVPLPGPGEVLVRMAASPINPADLSFLRGGYGTRKTLPVVPGFEGSGMVVAAGPGPLPRLWLGRRIACGSPGDRDGTWAEYMVTQAFNCLPLLPSVSLEQGAMLIVNPLTAWVFMDLARRGGHQAAVSTAAAGAVGQMILRLGLRWDYPVVHVVRRQAQVELLRGLGAVHVLNSSEPDFDQRLREVCRQLGATVAFDAVAGELTGRLLTAMPRGGRVVVYGALSQAPSAAPSGELIYGRKRVEGFWLAGHVASMGLPARLRIALVVQRLLNSDLKTTVRARMPLEQVGAALTLYRSEMTGGKILLVP